MLAVTLSIIAAAAFAWPFVAEMSGLPTAIVSIVAVGIAPVVLVGILISAETTLREPRVLALVGVLAALAAAARLLSAGVAGIEFVFVVVILAGRILGARLGFVVGAMAMAVSSMVWGGFGPWTAFQMMAVGWVGAGAGLLPLFRLKAGKPFLFNEIALLMVYGAVASYAFGLVMNLWFWPLALGSGTTLSLVQGAGLAENAASFLLYSLATSTLTWDTVRAITTVVTLAAIGGPAVKALRRVYVRPVLDRKVFGLRVMKDKSVS
jgi:hypothetical protein